MAPGRERPSPIDRFTDASATAITSGFSAAMALGPQPKAGPSDPKSGSIGVSEGTDWLRSLQRASGMGGGKGDTSAAFGVSGGRLGEDDDLSEDEDGDSEADSANGGKKKGKKGRGKAKGAKATNDDSTAAQRKAQNRIAQREFRQRKQQYIRALEARVELLSSDHDTQVDRLRYALRGLLAENNQLRTILGSFASFVGSEMIGGPLQKSGMSRAELESIIFNSSEKTMTETWQNWPGARECEALRQIRLESNLPPEGLPESHKLPEHAIANTAAAHAATEAAAAAAAAAAKKQNGHSSPASVDTDKRSGPKRKTTADGEVSSKSNKKKQQQGRPDDGSPMPATQAPSAPAPQSQLTPSAVPSIPPYYDASNPAHLSNFFSQPNMTPNFASPSSYSPYPSNRENSISAQPQDSSAILASLFGANGMGGFMGHQASSTAHLAEMNVSSDSPIFVSSLRQRTVANIEEPEEIKRISGFAASLRGETLRFGRPKDEMELSRVVQGISQLIYEMANFRRQPSYQLPLLLEPTDIQQTRPHDPYIDALPFAGLRQRLIEHQDSLLLDQVFISLLYHTDVHPGEVTEESNWELKEGFIFAYPQLIDRRTLSNANRWRSSRDESLLSYETLSSLMQ